MKIKKLLLAFGAIFATLGVVACTTNKTPSTEDVVKHTVTLDFKNGNPSTSFQVIEGQKATKPTDPEKPGFVFKGWYKEENYQNEWNFDVELVTENVKLYAKWEEVVVEKYSISYNMKEHGVAPASLIDQTALPNPLPTVEDVEGWHFVGWYLDAECNTIAEAGKAITQNTVLYAKWEEVTTPPVVDKYNISFNMHGHGEAPSTLANQTALPNPLPTVEDVEGWHFVGWYLDEEYVTPAQGGATITAATTLHAKWEETTTPPVVEKYNISFNMHGHGEAPINLVNQTALPNPLPTVEDVEGWHFVGWYLDEEYATPAQGGATITAATTLHAKWEETTTPPVVEKYDISFNMHGHGEAPATLANQTALPNSLPNVDDVEGWHFVGWYLDAEYATPAQGGATITAATTLHAKWEEVVVEKYSISYNINGKGEQPTNISEATKLPEELPILTDSNHVFSGWYLDDTFNVKATPNMVLTEDVTLYAKWVDKDSFVITKAEGYLEGAYLEWNAFANCTDYHVYYKKAGENDSTYKKIDQQLIREYPNKYRADVLGLAAGNYVVKAVPVQNNEEIQTAATESVTVVPHERSGFAFSKNSKYKSASGAYNDDGTLKSDAVVVYVTASNAKTVSCTLKIDGTDTKLTGLQGILDGKQKRNSTQPLCIRMLGLIKASDLDAMGSSSEGLQIKGNAAFSELNTTIEGVGEDATISGFGFLVRNCGNVEFRNFGIMNQKDDGISIDTDNCNIWVHNLDIYYGAKGSGDKAKGDGSVDTKISTNVTISYNHFWDSGKCNLQGMKSEATDNYITYHHNWYDHSDSRHPRIRTCTVHIYNNYFDGNAKYGVGVTTGASAFVENNYFRNCKNPMMISGQGTDALGDGTFSGENGGVIKAFGNHIEGASDTKVISYQSNSTSFDAYMATTREEQVPSTVKALAGETTYNNFDTDSNIMYTYSVDTPEVAREKVMKYAGRVNGGDMKWTFDNATQDRNYDIIPELSNAILSYKTTLVRVLGIEGTLGGGSTGGDNPGGGDTPVTPNPPVVTGSVVHNFTEKDKVSDVFTINGNTSTSKGTVTYKGLTLTKCLKMESSTTITFNTTETMTLILVFVEPTAGIKLDGTARTATNGIISISINSGSHTIIKGSSGSNLFYIELVKSA